MGSIRTGRGKGGAGAIFGTMGVAFGGVLLVALVLPLVALAFSSTPSQIFAGVQDPAFRQAMWLSLWTTVVSLAATVVGGTPLAWWLAQSSGRAARFVEVLVELPVIMPPAVLGIALLETFGRSGLLGPLLEVLGVSIPFTSFAVVLAQIVVSAPFFVQGAANAFRKVDRDMLTVARTLGESPGGAFLRVAVPIAMPGLVVAASLAWARSLGEFGATLLFAGNMPGSTQTMPLAIFATLETDVELAVVFALCLGAIGTVLLIALRLIAGGRTSR